MTAAYPATHSALSASGDGFQWPLLLQLVSDAVMALSFLALAAGLVWFIRKRRDLPLPKVFLAAGGAALLCGLARLVSLSTPLTAPSGLESLFSGLAAAALAATLVMAFRALPKALAIPPPHQLPEVSRQLQEANARLERLHAKSQERGRLRLDAIVDNVLDGIVTINERGEIESFNRACQTIFGYTADEVLGRNVNMLMPEPYHSEHDGYLGHYMRTGEARIIGSTGREVMGRRKDGAVFPLELSVSAFTVDGVRHFSGMVRDITRAKQAEEARERLLARLTESNTELERFAYVASHDMQEPLRMVMNFTQIITEDYKDRLDDEGREYLKIVGDSAHRMRDMVQELLDYARLGRDGASTTDVDMAVELEHVKANLSQLISDSGAVITNDPLPFVQGNAVQIMRLLQNLIGNAIKYQPPGNTPVIYLGVLAEAGQWHFFVRDNGIGIDPSFIDQVFEPFRRLHTWEAIKGTGLGLSVCKKIVESHGGRIWMTPVKSGGSEFHFTLPRAD